MTDVGSEGTAANDPVELVEAHLSGALVSLWLIVGAALVVTAVLALGWQLTAKLWIASAAILATIALLERVARRPLRSLSRISRLN